MLVSKIQTTDQAKQTQFNNRKFGANLQIIASPAQLSCGIDTKDFVGITFKGAKELVTAAGEGNLGVVIDELNKGTDINSYFGYIGSDTALIRACQSGHLNVVQELLSHKDIKINAGNEYHNYTALMEACWRNDSIDIIRMLLEHPDIDVNAVDDRKNTAMYYAIRKSNQNVKILLEHPKLDINHKGENGQTFLHFACKERDSAVVELLLQNPNIDINVTNDWGSTPIMTAISNNAKNCALKLLSRPDIDLRIRNKQGQAAYELAKGVLSDDLVKELEERYIAQKQHPELIVKVQSGNVQQSRPVVQIDKLSPEENIWTQKEITNKFIACIKEKRYNDALKMIETSPYIDLEADNSNALQHVLLTHNTDFATKVFEYKLLKQKPMLEKYNAKRKEFLENTIKTLSYNELKKNNIVLNTIEGFNVLMTKPEFNPNGVAENITLFERACRLDPEGNLAKQILGKYSDVITVNAARTINQTIKNLINEYESVGKYKTVLNNIKDNTTREETRKLAAQQLTDLIESENFKPEMTDSNGNTVLHIAAALPEDSARMLIVKSMEKGVDINAENVVGGRPLMSAIMKLAITKDEEGRRSMLSNIRFLLDKGANVDAQDQIGQTALHFACSTTIPILLTMLLSKDPNVFIKDKHGCRACTYLKTQEMKDIYNKYIGAV